MSSSSRTLITMGAALISVALTVGVATPSSASIYSARIVPATSHTPTATVSQAPYRAQVSATFPGYDNNAQIDDSVAVIDIPASSTRITFDLGTDAAALQLKTVHYWVGTKRQPVQGTATVGQQGRTVSIDVPADTFTVGDNDAFFNLRATITEPKAGAVLPPTGYPLGYTLNMFGALKVIAPARPSTIELPLQKASLYFTSVFYWATLDSAHTLDAGDQVLLSTGRPNFFLEPSPNGGERWDTITGPDDATVVLPSKLSNDAADSTLTLSREAIDTLGPQRSNSLRLVDRQSDYPPTDDSHWAEFTTIEVPLSR